MPLSPEQQLIGLALGYKPMDLDMAERPYPVETCLPQARLRAATERDVDSFEAPCAGWPMVSHGGEWYPAPTMDEAETYVFDSTCPTPDGSDVEPDDPGSWLSILGLI